MVTATQLPPIAAAKKVNNIGRSGNIWEKFKNASVPRISHWRTTRKSLFSKAPRRSIWFVKLCYWRVSLDYFVSFNCSSKLSHEQAKESFLQCEEEWYIMMKVMKAIKLLTFSERKQSDANPKVVNCVAEPTKIRGKLAFHPRYRAAMPPSFHRDLKASHDPEWLCW